MDDAPVKSGKGRSVCVRAPERGGIAPEVIAVVVQFKPHGGPNPAG
jgi:hypothetical protein